LAFQGLCDVEIYLVWECEVDKIYQVYKFEEISKVKITTLEFEQYTLIWGNQVQKTLCMLRD